MSTPTSHRDGDAAIPLPLRTPLMDENALHDAFLAEYPTLTAQAKAMMATMPKADCRFCMMSPIPLPEV